MHPVYQRLQSLEALGVKFGLENIRSLLHSLGNPDRNYPSILIAGTNGKGSVGAMLEAILAQSGFRTGYYLSPHLIDVRERIRINKRKIPDDEFLLSLTDVFDRTDHLGISPTYFETLTAAALLHFKKAKVDCAIVEVGLGGRYDATNSITQSLSIITSIGLDHEKFLGGTPESIAVEKAMITKPGVPMIIGKVPPEALRAITDICENTQSPLHPVNESDIVRPNLEEGFPVFYYRPWETQVRVNLRGSHQIQNAAIALLATSTLREMGWNLDKERAIRALAEVRWPGRLQLLDERVPPLLLDCAHNPMGIQALMQFMNDFGWSKAVFLFTAMKDKNIDEMLRLIAPKAEQMVLCRVEPLERCATEEQLCNGASDAGLSWTFQEDVKDALRIAETTARKRTLPTLACGSIYLIGRLFSHLGLDT